MAGPMPGLLTLMEELYGRINKERLFGGGVVGAATRGLFGADAPENATPAEMEAYRNIANASMALAAGPVAATRAMRGAKTLKNAPQAQAMETARQNAVKMLGLPESNTAMDRARAMGFDTEAYHGAKTAIEKIDPRKSRINKAFFASEDPSFASSPAYTGYGGGNVMPLVYRSGNEKQYGTLSFNPMDEAAVIEAVRQEGKSAIRVDKDGRLIVLDPSRVRSRFAAFDPARIDEKDLLASLAAMGITLPLTVGLLSEQTD